MSGMPGMPPAQHHPAHRRRTCRPGRRRRPCETFFIMSAIWRCCFISLLISATSTPEPAAMRLRRLALSRSGLARSFLVIELMMAIWRSNTFSSTLAPAMAFFIWPMPGIMPISDAMPPIFFICWSWPRRSSRSNEPFLSFLAIFWASSAVTFCGGLFDQRDDVAHAQDAVGDARGMEILERIHLFADADQLDRLAGRGAHRERRAAAAIAIDAGEDDAGDIDAAIEGAREIDRVLAGQRIGDEQDFVRIGDAP